MNGKIFCIHTSTPSQSWRCCELLGSWIEVALQDNNSITHRVFFFLQTYFEPWGRDELIDYDSTYFVLVFLPRTSRGKLGNYLKFMIKTINAYSEQSSSAGVQVMKAVQSTARARFSTSPSPLPTPPHPPKLWLNVSNIQIISAEAKR